ncbi:MAG: HNH endonuclease [Sphingomonas sp.]|jgi:putative restriction endonuclease|uniref:HNH endonuclease n=1 Tax=Sphingomonas sp. TaxID=28214 RepID=UPI00356315C5
MAFCVFMHRIDSIYDDSPSERYQFPSQYLGRATPCVGDWIIYLEPRRVRDTRGYFAVAKVERIVPDPAARGMYLALIEPGSYCDFASPVAFNGPEGVVERGLLNERGRISGRAQAAVRALSPADFNRIVTLGLDQEAPLLPRVDGPARADLVREEIVPFQPEQERDRVSYLTSRIVRDPVFRRVVLRAYDERCAITGLKLINGGGRAEVEAAHIRPVEAHGPDIVSNGLALSGTAHWMFDRGLISLADDMSIMISRQVNDPASIRAIVNPTGRVLLPARLSDRPHPHFVQWHRENCFKH